MPSQRKVYRTISIAIASAALSVTLSFHVPQPALGGHASDGSVKPLGSALQLVIVVTPEWAAVDGMMQRYERTGTDEAWHPIGPKVPVVVGQNGMAWGKGLHTDPPSNSPLKKEGDKKAPAGLFSFGSVFGYATAEGVRGIKLPYMELRPDAQCVDDVKSRHYNRILNATETPDRDWSSFEKMRRQDDLYRWGLVVDQNARPPEPGAGSCIFLHIWRGPSKGTAGCTAFEASQVEAMIHWLDPSAKPVLVQLPASEFKRLKAHWNLPDIP